MALVFCKTRALQTQYQPDGQLTVAHLEQPYGPLKIAKSLHSGFVGRSHPVPNGFDGKSSPQSTTKGETPSQRQAISQRADASTLHGTRVMLVEDNNINLKLLVACMKKLNVAYDTAVNGLEALNLYKEADGNFDVILTGKSDAAPNFFTV